MHSPALQIPSKIAAMAASLMLATLWLLMHGYHGLTGDAQIYAFQAFARINPQLAADLYLQNTSQDQFTIFSPFYAAFIRLLGLESAARLLTLLFTVWLMAAAWSFVRTVAGRAAAWLGIAFLLIADGGYGGSGVFRLYENFLTARLPAECLIVTAFVLHFQDRRRFALCLAVAALLVHPLIALPGLLLLMVLSAPARWSVAGAIAGMLVALGSALLATTLPAGTSLVAAMDPAWLEVVRERSQFLLLPLWSVRDWDVNIQPLLYLAFMAAELPDPRIRQLCRATALVAATGLAVAWIGSAIGPVAILVQGQAWRWVWVAVFVSAALLPAAAAQVWRDPKCGALCAALLVAGFAMPPAWGILSVSVAFVIWHLRNDMSASVIPCFRWAFAAFSLTVAVWILIQGWSIVNPPPPSAAAAPAQAARDIFELKFPALLFTGVVWTVLARRKKWIVVLVSALLAALAIVVWPAAFKQTRIFADASAIEEFSDWRGAIPATGTVLMAPAQDVGGFVWFTLGRSNYLALDQSAGVVFSRETALEVHRRSDVLLPLMDPNWKILAQRNRLALHQPEPPARPLTAASLVQVCADPKLGFVASPVRAGVPALRHSGAGALKDWYLYDCGTVRAAPGA